MIRIGGMRIVAALIDWVILVVGLVILNFVVVAALGAGYGARLVTGIIDSAIVLGYFYTEVLKAQSPGKMLMKYKITNQEGGAATQDQLLKRYLIKMSAQFVGIVGAILSFSTILALLMSGVQFIV